jgi:hypothetical protein
MNTTETKKEIKLFQITLTEKELFLLSSSLSAMTGLLAQNAFIASTAAMIVDAATTKEERKALAKRLIQLIDTIKDDSPSTL